MRRFYSLNMNSDRKTEINPEEIEDDENDFFCPEDDLDEGDYDDEPQEREYCD